MTDLLTRQQNLLADKLRVLQHIESGLAWSLARLPPAQSIDMDDPATAERVAAIIDRFCKLQDQLAGAMRHAHGMLGEKQRNFHDVVIWAVSEAILPNETTWLELRSLRNRLTHEYDPASTDMPELIDLVHQRKSILADAVTRFARRCAALRLLGAS